MYLAAFGRPSLPTTSSSSSKANNNAVVVVEKVAEQASDKYGEVGVAAGAGGDQAPAAAAAGGGGGGGAGKNKKKKKKGGKWNVAHAVLGLICTTSIQRCVFKIMIALFLSREFKHDETNRAWWTGRWYGRNLGAHAFSQPAREFLVKVVEQSLFSADFLTCHLLLFILGLPCLIPGIDSIHSTMLFWLKPSSQIRSPIFSFKQRALRRSIIWRFGLLYAAVMTFFATLIVIPVVFRTSISNISLPDI